MALDSGVLARSFQIAADEMTKLAPFIDDLDGVGGGDCDTGTNARVTFQTLAHGCEQLSDSDPLSVGLDCAIQSGIRGALGHCGVLLVSFFLLGIQRLMMPPSPRLFFVACSWRPLPH